MGKRVGDFKDARLYETQGFPDTPALVCYHAFDDKEARVLSLELADDS